MLRRDDIRWYETEGGVSLPSVTSILKMWPKDGLIQWAANCAANHFVTELGDKTFVSGEDVVEVCEPAKKAYNTVRDEAAGVGTMIHDAIEILLKGDNPANYYQQELVLAAVDAWNRYVKDNMVDPIAIEKTVIGDGYAGRIDLVANVNGRITMLDFKTSKQFYDSFPMQLSAYCKAFTETYGIEIAEMGVLRFDKSTGRMLYKDYTPVREQAYDTFKHLLNLFESALVYWDKLKEAKRAKGY